MTEDERAWLGTLIFEFGVKEPVMMQFSTEELARLMGDE